MKPTIKQKKNSILSKVVPAAAAALLIAMPHPAKAQTAVDDFAAAGTAAASAAGVIAVAFAGVQLVQRMRKHT